MASVALQASSWTMMRQSRKQTGQFGIALMISGLVIALTGVAVARQQPGLGILAVFGASMVYIPGGLLAVSHYSFIRGSKFYLFVTLTRTLYALAAVLTFVLASGQM